MAFSGSMCGVDAGHGAYSGDFVERCLLPFLYPENLTLPIQQVLGGVVVGINLVAYALAYQA